MQIQSNSAWQQFNKYLEIVKKEKDLNSLSDEEFVNIFQTTFNFLKKKLNLSQTSDKIYCQCYSSIQFAQQIPSNGVEKSSSTKRAKHFAPQIHIEKFPQHVEHSVSQKTAKLNCPHCKTNNPCKKTNSMLIHC